jgi:hypothetical protein
MKLYIMENRSLNKRRIGVFLLLLLTFIFQHYSIASASTKDCFWLDNALDGTLHKKECILGKEDVTLMQELHPVDFWKRIGKYANRQFVVQSDSRIMEHSLFRIYFFANFPSNILDKKGSGDSAAYLLSSSDRKQSHVLGQTVSKEIGFYVVADDIPFEPILTGQGRYSNKYYPRLMGRHALTFLKGFYLTKDRNYSMRFFNMLDYLDYSQFKQNGYNKFIEQFCSKKNNPCLPVNKGTDVSAWTGGFDYTFDFEWLDGYGYKWQLHEPDHHVNSINAVSLVKGFELSKNKKYLNAAYDFVYNQIPRYGYHTGVWNNQRYYWTEYNPSGKTNPVDDATDNVQSLVAHAVAMVGYYTKNMTMLEYARGLLWYNLREFKMDSRWFYNGAENRINARKSVSHDDVTLKSAIETLPYLIKAGMNVKDLVDGYYDAFMQYLNYDNPSVSKMMWKVGSVERHSTEYTPRDLAHIAQFQVRAWKTFSLMPKINQPVNVTYFFQINNKDIIQNLDNIILTDNLIEELSPGAKLSLSRYSPISGLTENIETVIVNKKSAKLDNLFSKNYKIGIGDILCLSFKWIPSSETSLAYKASKFELLVRSAQGGNEQVKSTTIVMDPDTDSVSELLKLFYKNYFIPREID